MARPPIYAVNYRELLKRCQTVDPTITYQQCRVVHATWRSERSEISRVGSFVMPREALEDDSSSDNGDEAEAFVADLSDPDQAGATLVARVAESLGPIDVLVNNAAANFYHPLEQMSAKRFGIAVEVNMHAPLALAQAVVPTMRERGAGWILNISSATATMPTQPPSAGTSGPLLYVATKAGLERATVGPPARRCPSITALTAR